MNIKKNFPMHQKHTLSNVCSDMTNLTIFIRKSIAQMGVLPIVLQRSLLYHSIDKNVVIAQLRIISLLEWFH